MIYPCVARERARKNGISGPMLLNSLNIMCMLTVHSFLKHITWCSEDKDGNDAWIKFPISKQPCTFLFII